MSQRRQAQRKTDLIKLDEATAFERIALGSLTPLAKPIYPWVDLRGSAAGPGPIGQAIEPVHEGTAAADAVRSQVRPLVWGAAWKVLDLVVEYALPLRRRWLIKDKVERAKTQQDLTVWRPFTKRDAQWKAALRLYRNTVDLRHSMMHDRERLTREMTPDEQLAFCRATRRLIGAILAEKIEPRERDDLAFHLSQVRRFSKVRTNPEGPLTVICEIHINLRDDGAGGLELDAARVIEVMRGQPQCHAFNLVAYLPDPLGARPLIGKLEDAPLDFPITRFPIGDPPEWLSDTRERMTLCS